MLLQVDRLKKKYAKSTSPALKDISFSVAEGEFIAILGLSGAGKSTLIRCINRLITPTQGTIRWLGKDITIASGKDLTMYRRSIGMIFQTFNLVGRLSVLTNVLVGRLGYMPVWRAFLFRYKTSDIKAAEHALERVGLFHVRDKRADQLSGGQQQRVAIARALVQQPILMLGDEPVASLDPMTSKSIMDILQMINRKDKITMMVNLHDVELAKQYATRVLGISRGKIVFDGPPEKLTYEELNNIYS
ncbi:phosphonate ABC transporter ATP-binding protein [Ammoniphilus oxalaticus]|uniref:Phosphonate ABC transporter ATP-binding protein n=1 Tax=Ammoniphilus oxalaticus TaxID=66863 RepID=A0A419SJF9_9BACL|nr:phosphonate ABC transporter ATP-binding protein [Ammoniphilus oxalaticus]RKD24038.1 phosphonate ABC transporter ATP-binding protein [Ammoniphilus oxalaticus]